MEAGLGTLLRLESGQADVVLAVADPTAKAIDVTRRVVEVGSGRAEVIVVANRVRGERDLEAVRAAAGSHELAAVPEDAAVTRAERDGRAPIDVDPGAAAVLAVGRLARRLARRR